MLTAACGTLLQVVEAADKTTGGLLLTEGSKEKPTMGKVGQPATALKCVHSGEGRSGKGGWVH